MSETTTAPATPPLPEEPKERKILFLPISEWVKICITVAFTAPISILGYLYISKSPHLYYTVIPSLPFKGEKSQLGIFQLSVTNDGSKETKNVQAIFPLQGMKIQEKRLSPSHLKGTVEVTDEAIQFFIPLLNVNETASLSFVAHNTENVSERPSIVVRSEGITGEDKSLRGHYGRFIPDLLVLITGIQSAYIFYIIYRTRVTRKREHAQAMSDYAQIKSDLDDAKRYTAELSTITTTVLNTSKEAVESVHNEMRRSSAGLSAIITTALNTSKEALETMNDEIKQLTRENEELKAQVAAKAIRPKKKKPIEPPKDAPEPPSPEAT